ncbi:hypothetical protein ABW21_db0206995 [Orbilia brochopaga]|nr:hypothetical protein ABW21_db0206995 [Drechslerella brochopaga]
MNQRAQDHRAEHEQLYDSPSIDSRSSSIYSSYSTPDTVSVASEGGCATGPAYGHLREFLDGEGMNNILNNRDPESLLPMLAHVLDHYTGPDREEIEIGVNLRRLFYFAAALRDSTASLNLVEGLSRSEATDYQYTINKFLLSFTRFRQPMSILQDIFHHELNLSRSSVETKKLILTVLADLPFLFEGWVNLWIGLAENEWCSIWSLTCYIREVESRVISGTGWLSRQGQWVSVSIAEKAGIRAPVLLQNPKLPNMTGYHVLPQAIEVGVRGPGLEEWERREQYTKTLMSLTGRDTPDSAASRPYAEGTQPRIDRPLGIQRRSERPRGICWEYKSPQKEETPIDIIISKYAQQPRLRSNEEEQELLELARRKKSEEEFNKELKRKNKEKRLKQELEELDRSGAFGNEARSNLAHMGTIFLSREAAASSANPLKALLDTIVEQDREIEDTHFETWAMEILEETADGPEDGDRVNSASSGSWRSC